MIGFLILRQSKIFRKSKSEGTILRLVCLLLDRHAARAAFINPRGGRIMKTYIILAVLLLTCTVSLRAQFSDDFDEDALNTGWSWVRESPSNWRLGGGALTIWTERGALNTRLFNNVRNMLLQPLPGTRDFMMDTELRFTPYWTLRNAGLLYYVDDDNYIRISRGIHDGHNDIWMEWEVDGVPSFRYAEAEVGTLEDPLLEFRLRLKRESTNEFSASYQVNSDVTGWTSWNSFATETIAFPATEPRIGLQAANGDGMVATALPEQANFNYFHYSDVTSVRPLHDMAVALTVESVHPAPSAAGSVLTMSVSTDRAAALQWRMTDLLGREVIAPTSLGQRERGTYDISVPTGTLPPGVYLWQVSAGSARATRRILLTR